MRLVRVTASYFVAGFETDGVVRRAAPILHRKLIGRTDDQARQIIADNGWKAVVVSSNTSGIDKYPLCQKAPLTNTE